ncbi:hypothetical protein [Bacillus dakarensis]|uniref:hypothetical protein n=1 Tax=Robertmurraya dakarensis TaxID=1926278 RepID=UPI0009821ACE|nr:hypothetical protein [Bacillus dakarensis]
MEKKNLTNSESDIREASKRGAVEDIIHVSSIDEGYDLRAANPFGANLKQELDFNGEEKE